MGFILSFVVGSVFYYAVGETTTKNLSFQQGEIKNLWKRIKRVNQRHSMNHRFPIFSPRFIALRSGRKQNRPPPIATNAPSSPKTAQKVHLRWNKKKCNQKRKQNFYDLGARRESLSIFFSLHWGDFVKGGRGAPPGGGPGAGGSATHCIWRQRWCACARCSPGVWIRSDGRCSTDVLLLGRRSTRSFVPHHPFVFPAL